MLKNRKTYENKLQILKYLSSIFLLSLFVIPVLVNAQQIIPQCSPNCGYYDLLKLVNNIINWIILVSMPVAAGVFAWAGFKYMTTGISDQKAEAKKMLLKVFFGFVFILSAWIIVGTLTNALLKDPSIVPVDTRP